MKKIASLLLVSLLLLGLLSGCGGAGNGGKTDLLIWLPPFAGSGDIDTLDQEFWTKALAPWAEINNVNLTIEITPWGNYEEKYLTGFSSGAGPDVGYMYLEMFNDFIEMETLEPLDSYFSAEEIENYLYYDMGHMKGAQYAFPFVVGNARVMYFNMDILGEAGVTELPTTWDDLIEVCTAIKDADIEGVLPFAQEWADPAIGALNNIFYPYLWQAGGDIYNKDGSALTLADNDAAIRVAKFLHSLRFEHGILYDDSLSLSEGAIRSLFAEGKVAIAYMPTNRATPFDEAGINWDFKASLQDEQEALWVASDSLIINSKSEHKELAASLIKFIASAEVMGAFHKEIANFPPITKDEPYNDHPRFEHLYENADILHRLPIAPNSFKVMDMLYKNLQLMMQDKLTPEAAIEETVNYYNSIS